MRRFPGAWAAAAIVLAGLFAAPERAQGQIDVGWLDVASEPPAVVFVDDVDLHRVTPQVHVPLRAGHHKLRLVTLDGTRRRAIGFMIEPGRTTRLDIHLAF